MSSNPSRRTNEAHAVHRLIHHGRMMITPWHDESVSQHGFPTLSRYVEWYWLPILGPTALLALRRMVSAFEWYSNGYESHVEELASSLGRLMYFGIVRGTAHSLAVRTHLPLVPTTYLQRLHPGLRASHDVFVSAERECAARPSCP
jgi:hypothetical protein